VTLASETGRKKDLKDLAKFFAALAGIVVILSLLTSFLVTIHKGMVKEEKVFYETGLHLPADATNIVDVGRGWQEFTYKGQRFLYHQEVHGGNRAMESIVRIDSSSDVRPEAQ